MYHSHLASFISSAHKYHVWCREYLFRFVQLFSTLFRWLTISVSQNIVPSHLNFIKFNYGVIFYGSYCTLCCILCCTTEWFSGIPNVMLVLPLQQQQTSSAWNHQKGRMLRQCTESPEHTLKRAGEGSEEWYFMCLGNFPLVYFQMSSHWTETFSYKLEVRIYLLFVRKREGAATVYFTG